MQKYKALKEFSTGPDEAKVNYEVDAIFELNPEVVTNIDELIKDRVIEVVADEEEKKEPEEEEKKEEPVDDTAAAPTEVATPKKFYRGSLIVEESPRTVGAQTFQHIKIAEGHELDLTEDEYKKDVTTE